MSHVCHGKMFVTYTIGFVHQILASAVDVRCHDFFASIYMYRVASIDYYFSTGWNISASNQCTFHNESPGDTQTIMSDMSHQLDDLIFLCVFVLSYCSSISKFIGSKSRPHTSNKVNSLVFISHNF